MKLFSKNFQKRIAGQKIFRSRKFKGLAILFACIGLLLCPGAFHIKQLTQHTIEKERANQVNENEITFEKIPHQPHYFNQFFTFIQNTKNVRLENNFKEFENLKSELRKIV